MAGTRMTTEIGAKALRQLLEYKHCGGLLIEVKVWLLSKTKWVQKYFIISKGAKNNGIWNLFCFADQFANRAERSYSMLEMESVRKYDIENDDVIGMRIIFITPKTPEVILRCDTEENREIWMTKLNEAIQEAHSFSADSGFASGGSIASRRFSRDSKDFNRQSNNYYTIDDNDIEDTPETTGNRTSENAAHLEQHKDCQDQTLSPTEIEKTDLIQQSNQLSKGSTGNKIINYENVVALLGNGIQVFETIDEEPPKGHRRDVNSTETHVKLPHPVQEIYETTTGNRTLENVAHIEEHKHCPEQISSPTEIKPTDLIQQSQQLSKGNTGNTTINYENVGVLHEGNGQQGFKIQDEKSSKEHCVVVNSIETHVKLRYPVQENNDSQVRMRDRANKHSPLNEEKTNKRKAVVDIIDDINVKNDETVSSIPALSSIATSESFVSVVSDTETSIDKSMSCLSVTSGMSSIRSDIDMGDYQNTDVHCNITNHRDSSSSSGSDTTTIEKPTRFSENFKQEEYVCEKRQNPRENMRGMPEGTFLIHRKEKGLRLHVMSQEGVKCFKIFEQNGKVSLYKDFSISPDSVFASLDTFLKHYSVHCIPKEEFKVTLTRGYKNCMRDTT